MVPNTEDRPLDLARSLMPAARDGEQIEVCVEMFGRTEVRVHGGEIESFTGSDSRVVGVRVVVDGREGTAGCGSFAPDMIDGLLEEARDNALFSAPDERAGIAQPDGCPVITSNRSTESCLDTDPQLKIDLALDTESRVRAGDPMVRGVRTVVYADQTRRRAVVTTTGVESSTESCRAVLSANALVDDPTGGTRTGFAAVSDFGPAGLDPGRVAQLAVERGLQLVGAVPMASARLPVVLPARMAVAVFGLVGSMLSGERVVKGRTPFGDRLGDSIAAGALTIFDDPTDPLSVACAEIDGEGLACRRVPLIDNGSLRGFLHDSRSARGMNVQGTGSAVRSARTPPSPGHRALHLSPGEGSLESIISGIDDGLLVLSLQGLHSGVNQVSGDFSAGVEGIRIRGGALAEAVKEGTLAGSIPRMLLDITTVGSDTEYLPGGSVMPTVVIDGMSVSGPGAD